MTYIKAQNPICDYVELHYQDATLNGTKMNWNIPNVYYSNLNSPMCTVSLVQSSIDNTTNNNLNVKWSGSVQNGFSTRNSGVILGHMIRNFDGGALTKYYLNESNTVQILTTARPQTIVLELVTPDDVGEAIDATGDGFFLLKFEYYDHKAVVEAMKNSAYPQNI